MPCGCYRPFAGGEVRCIYHIAKGKTMTPDKRATLLTAFKWSLLAALVIGSALTAILGEYKRTDAALEKERAE